MRASASVSLSIAFALASFSAHTTATPVPRDGPLEGISAILNSLAGGGEGDPNRGDNPDVVAAVGAATDVLGSQTVVEAALAISLCRSLNGMTSLLGLQAILPCDHLPTAPVVVPAPCDAPPPAEFVEPETTWEEPTETWEEPAAEPETEWQPEPLEEPEEAEPPVVHAVHPPAPAPEPAPELSESGCIIGCVVDLVEGVVNSALDVDSVLHLGVDGILGGDGSLLDVGGAVDGLVHVAVGGEDSPLDGILGDNDTPVASIPNAVGNQPTAQPVTPVPADSQPIEPATGPPQQVEPPAAPPARAPSGAFGLSSVADPLLHAGILRRKRDA